MSQDTKVIPFSTVSGVCNNSQQVAEQLHIFAEEIANGQWGGVRIATTVLDTGEGVRRCSFGPPGTNKVEVVGLLTYAIHRIIE